MKFFNFLKRKFFNMGVPFCQFLIKNFLLPYHGTIKKYAKIIGQFLLKAFQEICIRPSKVKKSVSVPARPLKKCLTQFFFLFSIFIVFL